MTDQRLPLLPESEWTDEVRDLFTIFEGEGARAAGTKFNIMKTLAHHPALMQRFLRYEHKLLREPLLAERTREIIILRLAWLYRQEYEWVQHVAIARAAGMSEAEIAGAKVGADDPVWSDRDRHLLAATEAMHRGETIDDATWEALAAAFSHREMIELLFTIGTFAMMSWIFNCTGLQLEDG